MMDWNLVRQWLPAVITVGGVFLGVVGWGYKFGRRLDENEKAAAAIPAMRDEQAQMNVQLDHIHTIQKQHGHGLLRMEGKVDRLVDKILDRALTDSQH